MKSIKHKVRKAICIVRLAIAAPFIVSGLLLLLVSSLITGEEL